ncbi:hypothetical protein HOK00_03885 [bacterium]|jgi:hypothetical protein|nr:hypothetical protein [bacterium]
MKIYLEEAIFTQLKETYNKTMITKKELAHELTVSVSTINNYIVQGYGIPDYVKLGDAKNAKVLFPIANVASYLSQTIKVA